MVIPQRTQGEGCAEDPPEKYDHALENEFTLVTKSTFNVMLCQLNVWYGHSAYRESG